MKLLTVSVAAYNVETYLDKCLASFADRRLAEGLEVLVINDGSTDRTAEIAATYAAKYPDIFRVINKPNGGHGSTVNVGMREASGKYFRVVDGDDWVNTEHLVTLLQQLATIDTDLVVDKKRTVHLQTGVQTPQPLPAGTPYGRPVPFRHFACERYSEFYNLHTVMVNTARLREWGVELREGIFYVDFEFILKVTAKAANVTFLRLDIYRYLIGNAAQSVDHRNYVRRIAHHRRMTEEVLRFAAEPHGARQDYVDRRVCHLINTHYNIALIYNENRREGAAQAGDFRAFLKTHYPRYAKMTKKRYAAARLLHRLGVGYEGLEKLRGRG